MRKIAATYLFTSQSRLQKNGILVCEDDGTVIDVIIKNEPFREEAGVEFYSGILVPGFVNAHCHLELSHLYRKIGPGQGLGKFIGSINHLRETNEEDLQRVMQATDRKMWASGIAAVGDISNSTGSLVTKKQSKIYYHTFVETFGFHPSRAKRAFALAEKIQTEFVDSGLKASIAPHAAYSVSESLFERVSAKADEDGAILSVHNQESPEEERFFKDGNGRILDHYQQNLRLETSHWDAHEEDSLEFILRRIPKQNRLLLVHNTFITESDLEVFNKERSPENTFLVVCPNSNLYIENQLPPIVLLRQSGFPLCIGTDSLASNHQLSVLEEMITIQKYFPEIKLEDLLDWACYNGACALDMGNTLGSFERGKKAGVNLIKGLDLKSLKLSSETKVKRLL